MNSWGVNFNYAPQPYTGGLAQAFFIGKDFIGDDAFALVLGDNIFHGHDFSALLKRAVARQESASVFAYAVPDPERYNVVEFDDEFKALSLEEKPSEPKSRYAVTGLYFYDNDVVRIASAIEPSQRGELEITDLNRVYLDRGRLNVEIMGKGMDWLDTGTHTSLLEASQFVQTLENRQGLKVACPEEIAWRNGWVDSEQLYELAKPLAKSGYGEYLQSILKETEYGGH